MSDLIGNSEDQFSHNEAHIMWECTISDKKNLFKKNAAEITSDFGNVTEALQTSIILRQQDPTINYGHNIITKRQGCIIQQFSCNRP